jgi:hypothetical protein
VLARGLALGVLAEYPILCVCAEDGTVTSIGNLGIPTIGFGAYSDEVPRGVCCSTGGAEGAGSGMF